MPADDRLLQRITVLPEVLDGKPCIRGSSLTVEFVLGRLAEGASPEAILSDYPELELDDVLACTAYAQTVIAGDKPTKATVRTSNAALQAAGMSLRELAARPPAEIDRVVRAAGIVMDAEEIEAWDGTAGDGLDE